MFTHVLRTSYDCKMFKTLVQSGKMKLDAVVVTIQTCTRMVPGSTLGRTAAFNFSARRQSGASSLHLNPQLNTIRDQASTLV
jgi:hypothetical protein